MNKSKNLNLNLNLRLFLTICIQNRTISFRYNLSQVIWIKKKQSHSMKN